MLTDDELLPLLKSAFAADTASIEAPDGLAAAVRRRLATRRRTTASVAAGAGVAAACAVGAATLVSGGQHTDAAVGGPSSSVPSSAASSRTSSTAMVGVVEQGLRTDLLPTPPAGRCLTVPARTRVAEDDQIFALDPRSGCLIGYTHVDDTRPPNAHRSAEGIFLAPPAANTRSGYKAFRWPAVDGRPSVIKYLAVTGYRTVSDQTLTTILRDVNVSARTATSTRPGEPDEIVVSAERAARSAAARAHRSAASVSSGRP